jgi:predicted peptidase
MERNDVRALSIRGWVGKYTATLHCRMLPAILLMALSLGHGQSTDGFEPAVYRTARGQTMPYRLYVPDNYNPAEKYPLVLFLHGFEALGSDNRKQISGLDYAGSHLWTRHECFVLAPQCPIGGVWALPLSRRPSRYLTRALELLEDVRRRYAIDPARIYATGQSLGGYGTWAAIASHPGLFAAAVPVCGGGSTRKAGSIAHVPVWAFHNTHDPIVLVHESRRMISAMRKAGGNPKYTEFPAGLHNAWDPAYKQPDLVSWVLAQRK